MLTCVCCALFLSRTHNRYNSFSLGFGILEYFIAALCKAVSWNHHFPPFSFTRVRRLDPILIRRSFRKVPFPRQHGNTKTAFTTNSTLESVFKKLRFRWPFSSDTCGRKPYPQRKSCVFKRKRIRVDGAWDASRPYSKRGVTNVYRFKIKIFTSPLLLLACW